MKTMFISLCLLVMVLVVTFGGCEERTSSSRNRKTTSPSNVRIVRPTKTTSNPTKNQAVQHSVTADPKSNVEKDTAQVDSEKLAQTASEAEKHTATLAQVRQELEEIVYASVQTQRELLNAKLKATQDSESESEVPHEDR